MRRKEQAQLLTENGFLKEVREQVKQRYFNKWLNEPTEIGRAVIHAEMAAVDEAVKVIAIWAQENER